MIVPTFRDRLERLFTALPGLAPKQQGTGWWGGLLTGAALGLVWAPCAGPVLAAITTLAATSRVTSQVVAVTAAYALGVGVPLLAIAYGGQAAIRRVPALSRRSLGIQRVFGGLMLVMALLIAFNADVALTVWATSAFPPTGTTVCRRLKTRRRCGHGWMHAWAGRRRFTAACGCAGQPGDKRNALSVAASEPTPRNAVPARASDERRSH